MYRADSEEAARSAEARVLGEIDRLAAIFSGYDAASEFRRWQATVGQPTKVSPELFGLLRGFLAAGVRSVAASLWPADDAATAALMVRFYSLLAGGRTKAAALRTAQREVRDRYPHPYHWAAFALVGER